MSFCLVLKVIINKLIDFFTTVLVVKAPSPILQQHGSHSPRFELEIEEISLSKEDYDAYFTPESAQLEGIPEEPEEIEELIHEQAKENVDVQKFNKNDTCATTLQRRLIARTPSVPVINESQTAQVT